MNGFHLERWYEKSEKTDASVSSDRQKENLGLSSASTPEDGASPLTNSPPSPTSTTNASDSEDDIPPLPPPLPSLDELRRSSPMFCSTPNRNVSI